MVNAKGNYNNGGGSYEIYYSKNISWQLIDNQIFIIDEVTKKNLL